MRFQKRYCPAAHRRYNAFLAMQAGGRREVNANWNRSMAVLKTGAEDLDGRRCPRKAELRWRLVDPRTDTFTGVGHGVPKRVMQRGIEAQRCQLRGLQPCGRR